jgi:hypothetical protein
MVENKESSPSSHEVSSHVMSHVTCHAIGEDNHCYMGHRELDLHCGIYKCGIAIPQTARQCLFLV